MKSERTQSPWRSTKVNALIQLILLIAQFQRHDIRFLECLCRLNHPLHITMRLINSEFRMMKSPPRSAEVNALIQLNFFIAQYQWHDIRFWGRLSRSNYPLHTTICFIKSERTQSPWRSTEVNALIQLNFSLRNINDMIFDFEDVSADPIILFTSQFATSNLSRHNHLDARPR